MIIDGAANNVICRSIDEHADFVYQRCGACGVSAYQVTLDHAAWAASEVNAGAKLGRKRSTAWDSFKGI